MAEQLFGRCERYCHCIKTKNREMKVVIIDYGAGNTKSVFYAFERLGISPILSNDATEILGADKVIFPGVGHARPAMDVLKDYRLDKLIPDLQQPVLAICLGMQLLCKHSDEGDTSCLGVFDENVKRFDFGLKVPHTGWNTTADNRWFYFVHSFYVPVNRFTTEHCDYGIGFSAAMQRDNFYAVQYHPEKSGKYGEELLRKFIESK